ncbi:NADP-dependent oxidoreductase [Actinospica durhamensis]|uniref:NADP-dependent oxidoreductase n=1 Tax=Actinospica durhamensis TaxID=1508375 RepID=A0A941ILM4_9ACTN|nr:NADP-dependent oxidoreductase [Actinospica durhamensis]MBR7831884.1 NADP-dependent oxidoreductase [Actinospica durhamensis]
MPSVPRPGSSREVRLVRRPTGLPAATDFEVVDAALPVLGDGDVLVRNRFFHVHSSVRMLIAGGVEGTPFTPLNPGDTLGSAAVGEVVEAPASSGLREGDLVAHWLGWREYAVLPAAACRRLDGDLPDPAAYLAQGWTAWAALTFGVELRRGETVFVSGGASSIGSMAGQIARLLGAGRVIGSTSSAAKARRMTAELGYDAVVLRGAEPLEEQLAKAAPDGVDVLFDNVGGEQLRAAVAVANEGARFVLIGALAGQLSEDSSGTTAPVTLDLFPVLFKRITLRGYSADDDVEHEPAWDECFSAWLRSGEIVFAHDRVHGIEAGPAALADVIAGRHFGAVIVEL